MVFLLFVLTVTVNTIYFCCVNRLPAGYGLPLGLLAMALNVLAIDSFLNEEVRHQ